jgi:hypothetical protein
LSQSSEPILPAHVCEFVRTKSGLDFAVHDGSNSFGHVSQRQKQFNKARQQWNNALSLITHRENEDALPESDGMAAARLKQILSDEPSSGEALK